MYLWRKLTSEQRSEVLLQRKLGRQPWHTPPHPLGGPGEYHLTAACYEHHPVLGLNPERMDCFTGELLETLAGTEIHAWCVLPNHYHLHITMPDIKTTIAALGRLHGRCSFRWNGEEGTRGRQVWHSIADRQIRNEAHGWATVNYIHHNPVRHGYVEKWQDWPWSSAREYLKKKGLDGATKLWQQFPVLNYGEGWDDPAL